MDASTLTSCWVPENKMPLSPRAMAIAMRPDPHALRPFSPVQWTAHGHSAKKEAGDAGCTSTMTFQGMALTQAQAPKPNAGRSASWLLFWGMSWKEHESPPKTKCNVCWA